MALTCLLLQPCMLTAKYWVYQSFTCIYYLEFFWIACAGASEARAARRLLLCAPIESLHADAPSAEASVASLTVSILLLQPSDLVVHRGPALDDWAVPASVEECQNSQLSLL